MISNARFRLTSLFVVLSTVSSMLLKDSLA
jgi:hypothetical protein